VYALHNYYLNPLLTYLLTYLPEVQFYDLNCSPPVGYADYKCIERNNRGYFTTGLLALLT